MFKIHVTPLIRSYPFKTRGILAVFVYIILFEGKPHMFYIFFAKIILKNTEILLHLIENEEYTPFFFFCG